MCISQLLATNPKRKTQESINFIRFTLENIRSCLKYSEVTLIGKF